METLLEAVRRETFGRNEAGRLRRQGRIPAVLYGGAEGAAEPLAVDPKNPLPFGTPGATVTREGRKGQQELLRDLNAMTAVAYPDDPALRARVKAYELAAKMQLAVPRVMDVDRTEAAGTKALYGLDNPATAAFGRQCLVARRLVERGVRFVQLYDGGPNGWDAHGKLKQNHATNFARVDRPVAGLLKDLKQRGMLDETLVVWATEFGRTPGAENADGRDHHPYGFSVWLAGGGIKGGQAYGSTDEFGFAAVDKKVHVHDLHATILHLMGLDHEKLTYFHQGRHERLTDVYGNVVKAVLA